MVSRAAAAVTLGTALWLSAAVFAPAGSGGWLAVLPPWTALAAALAAAALLVAWRPPSRLSALLPLVAVLLPWVPSVDAGMIYAGPLMLLVWAAVLAIGWGDAVRARAAACRCATHPNHATAAVFLIARVSTSIAAWLAAPMRPGGDEPHYLIMTQSLMQDGDLRIENNHDQRDYAAYAEGDINPQYLTRGKNGAIYPIHAPGLPALVIPAFAAAGYPGVVIFLLVTMALASALVWRLAWLATDDLAAAWFGWAAVAASTPWVFQSFLVFPEAAGAAAVACGLWLVLRLDRGAAPRPMTLFATGAALALLPWLHTRFAVLAAGLGLMIVLRLRPLGVRALALFAAAPVAAALGWFVFFQVIYGTPNPVAQWGGTSGSQLSWIPTGLAGALFDQQFGLLPYAPVLVAGLAGLAAGTSAGWRRATRLQVLCLLVLPYLAAVTSYAMWWGGFSVPARLVTALLPLLAPAAAVVWQRTHRPAWRAALLAALACTIFTTISLAYVDRGLLAWNVRQHKAALLFEWLVPLMQWTESLPAFFRADDALGRESLPLGAFYLVTLIWLLAIGGAVAVASAAARLWRGASAPALTVTALVLALPAATVLSLRAQAADGSAPVRAQLVLLNRLADGNALIVDLGRRRMVDASDLLGEMRLRMPAARGEAPARIGPVPAGTYRNTADPAGAPGDVIVGRGRPMAVIGDAPLDLVLPVAAPSIEVRGAAGRAVTLSPVSIPLRQSRRQATSASRYGAATVFFVDNRVYPERDGFWVRGARFANIVIQADAGARDAVLEIRNGPVANRLVVTGAGQPFASDLEPGATVTVPVTVDARGTARLQIDSSGGFVPADVEPGNRDRRFLGVYVRVK
jgi:hypothetical protein